MRERVLFTQVKRQDLSPMASSKIAKAVAACVSFPLLPEMQLASTASVLGDAAMTKAWHCYIGIVHPVDGFGRCLSLERLPPSTSQLWPQYFSIKDKKNHPRNLCTVYTVYKYFYTNLVATFVFL